jgi:MSHA pilin protein MshA
VNHLKLKGARALQGGFTLIELIIVIVVIGILAIVAIPQFTNVSDNAKKAAAEGVAGALGSASASNYALRSGISTAGTAIANCTDVSGLLQGGLPSGISIVTGAVAANATASCTVSNGGVGTATFTVHGIS